MANTTALGFTIFARERVSPALKRVGGELDKVESRMQRVRKVSGAGLGLAALAGSATALGAAVAPAAAAVAAMPAAMVATKVATGVLKVGLIGVGDAMSAVAEGDAKKLDEALEKLSPNARKFVRETAALKKEFDGVQRAVQDELFADLAAEMAPVARSLLPEIKTGMTDVAAGLNAGAKEAIRFAGTPLAKGAVNATFASTSRIMGTLAGATRPALQVITQLTVKSLPLAERMAAWATNGAKAAAAFLTSEQGAAKLERTVTKAGDVLAQLGRIGGNVVKGLVGMFSQAKFTADGLLDTLESGTAKFAAWSRSAQGQEQAAATFKLLHDAASAVVEVLPLLLGPLGAVVKLINGLPEPLREGAIQSLAFAVVVGTLTSKLGPLVSGVGSFIGAVTSADGPVQRFRDRLSGMQGAGGKMRGVLSGMVGMLTGPWGIALAGGAAVLGIFATRNDEAERRVQDLTDALMRNKGALDDQAVANIKNRLETEGVYKAAQQLGINLSLVTDAALGNRDAIAQVNAKLAENATVTQAVGGRGASVNSQWKTLSGTAKLVQDTVAGSNTELAEAREAYQRLIAAAPSVASSGQAVAGSVNGVGTAADRATGKVNALNTSLAKFRTLNGDADLAAIAFRDSLDELTTAFNKNNVSIDQRTGKIGINNKAGREATRVLIGSIQAAIEHSAKVREQTGSVDKANKVFATEINRLRGVLTASGLSRAEIDKLVARYAKMPGQINSATDKIRDRKVRIEVRAGGELIGYKVQGGTLLKASGGILPGYTPGRDVHMFHSPTGGTLGLSGGEAVMRPEWTKAVGPGAIEQMNRAARTGGVDGVRRVLAGGLGPKRMGGEGAFFAKGGVMVKGSVSGLSSVQKMATRANKLYGSWASNIGSSLSKFFNKMFVGGPGVQNALKWARSQAGKPYIWGGVGPRGYDCSGFMSAITNVIKGRKPYSRLFSTHSFGATSGPGGFVRNRNSGFRVGVTDAGVGHMAGTLGGVNVESRGSRGVVVGSAARGANNGLFTRRYGLKLASGGVMPWSFDNGGMLPEGLSMVHNGTGAPEPLGNLDKMPPAEVQLIIDSAGGRIDDLLVELLRRAIRVRGGNVQSVLGR
ncbi:phage tail tape measure protein [Nonomuraea gerenzanensis]|uniref:Phage tail length tape-measure protein n=1 Tax=Nonomuraea gerenzanensis TaxID=93944 RepID=A0A1M4EMP7_9ACTN|nr:hypothetical protein [Nonomuraea gerenzanensis]SBP00094.1 Phage tail length tape-measure protein [Nonomuraea gerenzanensis]